MEKQVIYSKENIKKVLLSKGTEIDGRPFFVNIIGIRNTDGRVNVFDDTIITMTYKNTGLEINYYQATVDPGLWYLQHPINSRGTGILKEGHYSKCWRLGMFKGHRALLQVRPMTAWRDNDKDDIIDVGLGEDTGLHGCHLHGRYYDGKSLDKNPLVNRWSAMCQVPERNADTELIMDACAISVRVGNGDFDYTLLSHQDFSSL